jgi:hypothetical protein
LHNHGKLRVEEMKGKEKTIRFSLPKSKYLWLKVL